MQGVTPITDTTTLFRQQAGKQPYPLRARESDILREPVPTHRQQNVDEPRVTGGTTSKSPTLVPSSETRGFATTDNHNENRKLATDNQHLTRGLAIDKHVLVSTDLKRGVATLDSEEVSGFYNTGFLGYNVTGDHGGVRGGSPVKVQSPGRKVQSPGRKAQSPGGKVQATSEKVKSPGKSRILSGEEDEIEEDLPSDDDF